jgi:hypothetical protein
LSFEPTFEEVVLANDLATLGTSAARKFIKLGATDRTGEGNDTARQRGHTAIQVLKFSPIHPEAVKKWAKMGFRRKIVNDSKAPLSKSGIFSQLPSQKTLRSRVS